VEAQDAQGVAALLAREPGLVNARIATEGDQEHTLLHRAIPPDGAPLKKAHLSIVKALLDAGAEVDGSGWGANHGVCTPLTMAALGGHAPLVRLLLAHGAEPDGSAEQIARRHRPVDTAAAHGHAEAVEALIEGGAEFLLAHLLQAGLTARVERFLGQNPGAANTPVEDGSPPLHLAADAETARVLLTMGADASARDPRGRTALHVAIEEGRAEVARVLIDSGAEWDIFGAAGLGEAARMQELLRREAHRARAVQADGVTALFYPAHGETPAAAICSFPMARRHRRAPGDFGPA
jgi:ankyrin repeat protein